MGQTTQIILPDTYYLDYFNFLVDFIRKNYGNIISDREKLFFERFGNMSTGAQCLFVRLANRKGAFFRRSKLFYREIPDIDLGIEELHRNAFLSLDHTGELHHTLYLFTKPEILSLGKVHGWNSYYKSSYKKEDIIFSIIEQVDHSEVYEAIFDEDSIIFFEFDEVVDFLKLLFFGDHYSDMTQFVIRDVGNIKLEDLENVNFTPNFHSRREVEEYLLVAEAYQIFKELKEMVSPLKCYEWFIEEDLVISTPAGSRPGKIFCKLVLKLAKLLEQHSFFIEALDIYGKVCVPPARERRVRLMHRLNEKDDARKLAEEILENPFNQSEALFASDFLRSKTKRIRRSTTVSLKAADEITLVKNPELTVEKQALVYFREAGYEAYHTENALWRQMFGLLFWEETYDTDQSSFHHPLQRLPSDIHDQSFYEKRADAIEEKLKKIRTRKALTDKLKATFEAKNGIINQYVYWSEDLLDLALTAVQLLPLKGLKEVLRMISIQVKSNSTGFPDLFIFKNKKYHFYEIKSPTDQLSAQQLFWIDFMTKCDIRADVLKINWSEI